MADNELISDSEKVRIASSFIRHIPPGEFNEVFNSVRHLVKNDALLKEGVAESIAQYNTEQLTPCKVENETVLITEFGHIGNSRYVIPNLKQSFKYDHLRRTPSAVQTHAIDSNSEAHRAALDKQVGEYIKEHFPNGAYTVYGKSAGDSITLTVCIEDHAFSPQNFWNGKWRSQFSTTFSSRSDKAELKGIIKVQVHYYEDGNVQLVSHKEVKDHIALGDEQSTAKAFTAVIQQAETEYQTAVGQDYKSMSDTTFKALRRQLPVTRTKIDWNKITEYKIGQELKGAEVE